MERLTLDQTEIDSLRDTLREPEAEWEQPCPGSRLKNDDDVQWLGFVNARVLWGHQDPGSFYAYAPEVFGPNTLALLPVAYVNDRAPLDPNEEPLPIYPEEPVQQFAQQPGVNEHSKAKGKIKKNPSAAEVKEVLTKLLASLPKEAAKKARKYIKEHRSDIELPDA